MLIVGYLNNLKVFGLAQTIYCKTVKLSLGSEGSVEEWKTAYMVLFDANGRKQEKIIYNRDGTLHFKYVFNRNNQGQLVSEVMQDANGLLLKVITYTRASEHGEVEKSGFNTSNELTEKSFHIKNRTFNYEVSAVYDAAGRMSVQDVEFYDDKERLTRIVIFKNFSGEAANSYVINQIALREASNKNDVLSSLTRYGQINCDLLFTYDDLSNREEQLIYDGNGVLLEKRIVVFDDIGNKSEINSFDANGNLNSKEIYAREFDSQGNWIVEIKSRVVIESSKLEPVEKTYREICYINSNTLL